MRRIRLAIGVLAASALLSACGLIGFLYPPVAYPPIDPNFSFLPIGSDGPFGTLRHGTATIKITSGGPKTIELTHLSGSEPSEVMPGFGSIVNWRTGEWGLQVMGGGTDGASLMGDTGLTITREDTDTPLQADGSGCKITFTAQTAKHIAGRAECKGLVWRDPFGMDMPPPSSSASPRASLPPFDATITFDATP